MAVSNRKDGLLRHIAQCIEWIGGVHVHDITFETPPDAREAEMLMVVRFGDKPKIAAH